ncbi:hypothetical protein HC766_06160 [Candidatus Gracilibacteria bacterium]|nr:hypothetical protein [Candidatus Gracilibacteria bacterium]
METETIETLDDRTTTRYWGRVTVIDEGDRYRINRIELKPPNVAAGE